MTAYENDGYKHDERNTSTTKRGEIPVENVTKNGHAIG